MHDIVQSRQFVNFRQFVVLILLITVFLDCRLLIYFFLLSFRSKVKRLRVLWLLVLITLWKARYHAILPTVVATSTTKWRSRIHVVCPKHVCWGHLGFAETLHFTDALITTTSTHKGRIYGSSLLLEAILLSCLSVCLELHLGSHYLVGDWGWLNSSRLLVWSTF